MNSFLKTLAMPAFKFYKWQLYKGKKVYCVVCGNSMGSFAPAGLRQRKNARCRSCGSLERHRLFWRYLNERTNFKEWKNINLLHFAPERVFHNKFSGNPNINYFPCDLHPERYKKKIGAPIHKVDVTSIPFEDNFFDVILCSHVLEHVPDDQLAMKQLHRVLKPNGWAILQVPIDYGRKETYEDFSITEPKAREAAFGQWDHVRWYGNDYKERLANAGFVVNEDPFVKTFSEVDIAKYGFAPSELIYYCTKKPIQ